MPVTDQELLLIAGKARVAAELRALRVRVRKLHDSYAGNDGAYPDMHAVRADLLTLLETD